MPALQLDRLELLGRAAGNRATLDGGHVLVGVEAEADQVAEAADTAPVPRRPDGVRGVLDDAQLVTVRNRIEAIHVDRESPEMHWHDCPRTRSDGGLDLVEVDVARIEFHVHKYRMRANAANDVSRSHKAQCGCDDLITGPDAARPQRHLHSSGGRCLRAYRATPEITRQLGFERGHLGAARQPSGPQHLDDRLNGFFIECRTRKGQHLGHHSPHERATRTTPAMITPTPMTRCAFGASPNSHQAKPIFNT